MLPPPDHDQLPVRTPAREPAADQARRGGERLVRVLPFATAAFLLARLPLLPRRRFDPDEFEHAHAAWSLFKGMLPYRDFFEHHTPWYYYLLRPFFRWFEVDLAFDSARRFLILGRGLSLLLTVLSVLIVNRIGRRWEDRRVGALAALFVVSQPVFLQKTIEMRPDVLALPFFLGSLWLLLCGLERSAGSKATGAACLFAGGLALGAAIMCTQKMLFVLPGAFAGLGLWALAGGSRGGAPARIASVFAFAAGIAVPATVTWAAFAAHHAGAEFITNNFLLNAKWKHFATNQLLKLMLSSGPIFALAIVGAAPSVVRSFRSGERPQTRRWDDVVLLCMLAGLFAGVLVVPAAHRQYYLMPLPIVCLFAARGFLLVVARVAGAARASSRTRAWFTVVALSALAVLPVIAFGEAFAWTNDRQLGRLRFVFDHTAPTDLVMDGWEGMGVFRPHAFHYFFLHEETVAMLPPARRDAYLDALERGAIRPKLIAMDENLIALGPRFVRLVEDNYVTRDGFFYLARAPRD